MDTRQAAADRIRELCKEQGITPNALSYRAGVSQVTIKSILNYETQNAGVVTIKKLCDGFEGITLHDFFNTDVFRRLEQEIKRESVTVEPTTNRSAKIYFLLNLCECRYVFTIENK